MSVATRLGLATRGLRGGFGETVIVEVPVEVPVNYYILETVDVDQPVLNVDVAQTFQETAIQELSVDVEDLIALPITVATIAKENILIVPVTTEEVNVEV